MNGFELVFLFVRDALRALIEQPGYGISVWFLVWVFTLSGVTKLRRPVLAAMAIVDFGVVRHVRPLLGGMLGAGELLLALGLALGIVPALFLGIASALLWLFVILIIRSLRAGEHFACFCFGDANAQLSKWTFVRTCLLAMFTSVLALAAELGESQRGFHETGMLQAIAALALMGMIVLSSHVPSLLRWNNNPLQPG